MKSEVVDGLVVPGPTVDHEARPVDAEVGQNGMRVFALFRPREGEEGWLAGWRSVVTHPARARVLVDGETLTRHSIRLAVERQAHERSETIRRPRLIFR